MWLKLSPFWKILVEWVGSWLLPLALSVTFACETVDKSLALCSRFPSQNRDNGTLGQILYSMCATKEASFLPKYF